MKISPIELCWEISFCFLRELLSPKLERWQKHPSTKLRWEKSKSNYFDFQFLFQHLLKQYSDVSKFVSWSRMMELFEVKSRESCGGKFFEVRRESFSSCVWIKMRESWWKQQQAGWLNFESQPKRGNGRITENFSSALGRSYWREAPVSKQGRFEISEIFD